MPEKTHFEQVALEVLKKKLQEPAIRPEKAFSENMSETYIEPRRRPSAHQSTPTNLIHRFDAFAVDKSGGVTWVGAAENRGGAEQLMRSYRLKEATEQFVLLDQRTGGKTFLTAAEIAPRTAATA